MKSEDRCTSKIGYASGLKLIGPIYLQARDTVKLETQTCNKILSKYKMILRNK